MKFSDRIGATTLNSVLQLNDINQDLRHSLWNYFLENIWNKNLTSSYDPSTTWKNIQFITKEVYKYLKIPIDDVPSQNHLCKNFIKEKFLSHDWYLPYNIIEHTLQILVLNSDDPIIQELNRTLEKEGSGYRFILNEFVPISDETEIKGIEEVFTSQDEASVHIKAALDAISNKENPDYRNCIKESISAVEVVARQITGKNTLGKALNNLQKKGVNINPSFKEAMEKLYTYSNDEKTGIRHSLMDGQNPPKYEEAKYMLVVCSAFANLLKGWNLKSS